MFIRSKNVMQLTGSALLMVSAASLYLAVTSTVSAPLAKTRTKKTVVRKPRKDSVEDTPSEPKPWERLFALRLQRPLFDPPPEKPVVVEEKPIPPPPIEIIATMPEPDGGSAMIRDDKSQISVVPIRGKITAGGTSAILTAVFDNRVELTHQGKTITMELTTK